MTTVADRLASERKRSERQRELRASKRAARLAELARRKEEGVRKKRGVRDRLYSEYRMTPTKREVLVLLAQYRYLRTTSLIALLPHRHPQGLRATLRLLFDEGLITQPREAFKGYNSLITPNIHMLTEKGETHLHAIGIKPELIARIYRKKTDAPIRNFGHAMMISDGLSSIQAGTLDTPVEFIPWTRIADVIEAYQEPPHDWGGETAWRLFNATTFALTGKVAENPSLTSQLHQVINGFCTPIDTSQLALPHFQ